jgi:type IV pilus assembly protein PilN
MIKVNLLKDHTVQSRIAPAKSKASPMGVLMLLVLALVGTALGASWFYLHTQVVNLTAVRDRLRTENARLQGLKKEIDRYEQMKQERQSRIDVIEQLKANQTGPVLLLNHIVHSIPIGSALWLTSLDQKGDQIRISGLTVRGETIPDFMSNLSATGFFKTVDLELYEDQQKDTAKFTLVCVCARKLVTE